MTVTLGVCETAHSLFILRPVPLSLHQSLYRLQTSASVQDRPTLTRFLDPVQTKQKLRSRYAQNQQVP